jgi:hypothetical protein
LIKNQGNSAPEVRKAVMTEKQTISLAAGTAISTGTLILGKELPYIWPATNALQLIVCIGNSHFLLPPYISYTVKNG